MNNLLYPEFFAPMPIINQEDGLVDAYVVSKCYLLDEIKSYYPNGTHKTKYNVVFQWTLDENNIIPQFSNSRTCTNSTKVSAISPTIEQCQTLVNELNAKLLAQRVQPLPIPESTLEYSRLLDLQVQYSKIAKQKLINEELDNL